MMRNRFVRITGIVVVAILVIAGLVVGQRQLFGPWKLSADFTTATGIYPGDDVRVSGVKVGTIKSIDANGTSTRIEMAVDRGVKVPADADAIIVAQNLVAARYVQLTPSYRNDGPTMAEGTHIPLEHTAVPVEWDEVKVQLDRLATDLGPDGSGSSTAGRFIDSAANAMAGNGDKLRETLAQLSDVGRILASGSGNIVDIIKNLQIFVSTLSKSSEQIVQFENRLASLTSVLDGSRSDLDAALNSLSVAVIDVQRFVAENTDRTSESVQRLANVTQNLADHKDGLEELLHVFPTSLANFYNMYNPETGTPAGVLGLNQFSNPLQFICGSVASIENVTAAEGAKRCADFLGPIAPMLMFNTLPFKISPLNSPSPPSDLLVYSEPDLIPAVVAPPNTPNSPAKAPVAIPDLLAPFGRPNP
ncbi:MCE family protein [Aldersonia sp. NBC_00410]|uniref:MCE family protein n=1 Tax=Aldersonia sp. NBC_00410 TaxID=2975954 RepID=UPI00225228EB|nr:MCE family protein [Aldersonia sp. NBC_00410]MCX5044280.1 MCE family protein [Aldersonia sp. NBC_00410]